MKGKLHIFGDRFRETGDKNDIELYVCAVSPYHSRDKVPCSSCVKMDWKSGLKIKDIEEQALRNVS